MQVQTFTLSLRPDDYPTNVPQVFANQYDAGRAFAVTILDLDGNPYTPNGETATICGTKPDGTGFSYDATLSGSVVSFSTTGQMTVVAGHVRCGIILTRGSVTVGTLAFDLYVQPAALQAGTIISSDDFDSIVDGAVEAWLDDNYVMPTISVADITGGHRVTVTDDSGTHTFDVMDGQDGAITNLDTTLSIAGDAADAKATGDRIAALEARGGEKILVQDNLLAGTNFTGGKTIDWATAAVVDADSNYFTTIDAIPCSVHDFPLYVVDKDMTLKATVFRWFTYNDAGARVTRLPNAPVPLDVNRSDYSASVYSARITLDRNAFGDADEDGNWAFVFSAQDYAKHVAAGSVYLYTPAPAEALAADTIVPRPVKASIASMQTLMDIGLLRYKSNNLFDRANGGTGYALDPRGYPFEQTTANPPYVTDSMTIRPGATYTFSYGTWLINKAYWLDPNGDPISQVPLSSTTFTATAPAGAYGVRCSGNTNASSHPYATEPYQINEGTALLDFDEFDSEMVLAQTALPPFKDWRGYKYYSIGDSRTAGDGTSASDKVYPKVIQEKTGIVNVNAGTSGASFCKRTGITIPTMYEQANNIPLDTDIVTIFGGTNDRVVGVVPAALNPTNERGTMDYYASTADKYDVTTFRGAVRQTIKNIKLRCPTATIIFLVNPLLQSPDGDPQGNAKYTYNGSAAWQTAVDGGASLADMIREVAETYAIPVLDITKVAMTGRAGDEYLASDYQPFADGLHESDFGNAMLARAVAGEMAKYLW